MATFTATFTLPDEQLAEGWDSDLLEAVMSLRARLDEFYGDDGGAYVPQDLTVTATAPHPALVNATASVTVGPALDT